VFPRKRPSAAPPAHAAHAVNAAAGTNGVGAAAAPAAFTHHGSAGDEALRALSEELRQGGAAAGGGGGGGDGGGGSSRPRQRGRRRGAAAESDSDSEATDDDDEEDGEEFRASGGSAGAAGASSGSDAEAAAGGGAGAPRRRRRRPPTRARPVVELPPRADDGPAGYAEWVGRAPAPPAVITCAAGYAEAAARYRELHGVYAALFSKIEGSIDLVHQAASTVRDAPPFTPAAPAAEAELGALLARERPVVAKWDAAFKALHGELRLLKAEMRRWRQEAAAAGGGGT
jgi:hypothetical protein